MTDTEFSDISIRHLALSLKDYIGDVPIHFTSIEDLDKTNYVSCRFMGNAEADAIRHGSYNAEIQYDDSDVGIHLPDITVDYFYCLENRRNPAAQKVILEDLMSNRKMYIKEQNIWFAIFCILHEAGHWKYYRASGLSAYDYEKSEHDIRDVYEKLGDQLYKMPDYDPRKISLAKQYHIRSHEQIPSERSADEYALQAFDDALKTVRESMGYDQGWLAVHWR